jgi:glutamate dehydrogenase
MALKAGDLELDLIEALTERVRSRLPDEPVAAYVEFVRQYYHWVPATDLADRDPSDLCGAVVAHWRTARRREGDEPKVRVYNPVLERDGWASPFTVVEVISDDMPFIVDSLTMELSRQGHGIELLIHPVIRLVRGADGEIVQVLAPDESAPGMVTESVIHAEIARQSDSDRLSVLRAGVELVLEEVRAAVEDWEPMRDRVRQLADELRSTPPPLHPHELAEVRAFLRWLAEDHFTFLGYREYELGAGEDHAELHALAGSGLGILRGASATPRKRLGERALALARSRHPLVLTKANSRATVHRPSYLDYVGVKRYGAGGEVIGERRFLGLYTTAAYKNRPATIPLLREKIERVLERAGFPPDSHDAKALNDILESLPRDLLVQIPTDDLFETAIGIVGLGERPRVRLFVFRDQLGRFVSCTLCLPRDRFNTRNRELAGKILVDAFGGGQVDWRLHLSESVVVRVNYVIHCPDGVPADYDVPAIEARITEATRAWSDDLRAALVARYGEQDGPLLHRRYADAFPRAYQADWSAVEAVADVERAAELERRPVAAERRRVPIISIYRRSEHGEPRVRCKLLSAVKVSLSDVLPTFEHLGAKVDDERPYELTPAGADAVWIYDFGLDCPPRELERVAGAFAEVFLGAWSGELEDDRLNGLVLAAGLSVREITVIRAIARYLRQATIAFSDRYMERTLIANPKVAAGLVRVFSARFDPDRPDPARAERIVEETERAIDDVQSLDEDRILRSFLAVLQAMLRTNYYIRVDDSGRPPGHLSFKLDPTKLPLLPRPRPRYEIFVYSPRVEGVHLRGGKVARGGLRWSDRREDFRTEVLGLMKAQMVKNALIVPVGSKGGFVVKRPPVDGGRKALVQQAIACYRTFLRGLLDLTDNYAGGRVVAPPRVVRYDDDDPYLVVAADKGTASFSDIANQVSADYGFWLGDAFASGGSHGYDHKQMGITARGAWESVKRHFRELGTDVQRRDFTAVGIGDMSGDVFGNAMLCSEHIRLLGAFDHRHVFLDPDPDAAAAYAERRRLFALPRSSWSDYDRSLISAGGGVYPRTLKIIPLSAEVREALGVEAEALSPADLIRGLLRAPVDLLFNGGIGTYVKATEEVQSEVGDRANDAVRVQGAELRCRVVGEGGNLGFTQRGRIEYAQRGGPDRDGGRINTDAIDNAAGVNCSDHEVNIKILLDGVVASGEMSTEERNRLLVQMTDAVAEQVIYGSYTQTQAMSISVLQAGSMAGVHARLLRQLEQVAGLDRELERLPDDEALSARRAQRRGLVAPELATVMAYCKIHLYEELLGSNLPDDLYLAHDLERYFPEPVGKGSARHPAPPDATPPGSSGSGRYGAAMLAHRLRREIIATVVANQLVDRAGATFVFRLSEETGAPASQLARAFAVAREVFEMRVFWSAVEALDTRIEAGTALEMLVDGRRLVERSCRWLVRAETRTIDIEATTDRFLPGARALAAALPDVLQGIDRAAFEDRLAELVAAGVPSDLARRVASQPALLAAFDIVEDAEATRRPESVVTATYFAIGSRLGLDWLRDRILELPRADRWQALARAALRDDLYTLHRSLTREVLESSDARSGTEHAIHAWERSNEVTRRRALSVLDDVRTSRTYDTTTLPVVLRELRNLIRGFDRLA